MESWTHKLKTPSKSRAFRFSTTDGQSLITALYTQRRFNWWNWRSGKERRYQAQTRQTLLYCFIHWSVQANLWIQCQDSDLRDRPWISKNGKQRTPRRILHSPYQTDAAVVVAGLARRNVGWVRGLRISLSTWIKILWTEAICGLKLFVCKIFIDTASWFSFECTRFKRYFLYKLTFYSLIRWLPGSNAT